MPDNKLLESMLFNYETTNRTELRDTQHANVKTTKTVFKPKPAGRTYCRPPQKYVHTMTECKHKTAPIDLFVKPKDVVHTDPRAIQQTYLKTLDLERDEVIRTRPRLVMTPAVYIDDLQEQDRSKREELIRHVYLTMNAAMITGEDASHSKSACRAPLSDRPAPPRPLSLCKLREPLVSPEWKMDSARWDHRQLRAYCDVTEQFWMAQDPNIFERCHFCKQLTR